MTDLVITAANVLAGAGATIEQGTAGAAVTAGQVVYRDPTTMQYLLADNNSATPAARQPRGIALHTAASGQPLQILTKGDITIGATVVAGVAYYLSQNPGGICAIADLAAGMYPGLLGMAKSTTAITIEIEFPNVSL